MSVGHTCTGIKHQENNFLVRLSAEFAVAKTKFPFDFVCETHSQFVTFFNNQRKRRTSSVTLENVK